MLLLFSLILAQPVEKILKKKIEILIMLPWLTAHFGYDLVMVKKTIIKKILKLDSTTNSKKSQ